MTERFMRLYQRLILDRPLLILLAIVLVALVAAAGLPNFKLDASADSLTLEHDDDLDYFREINQRYGSGDFLVITFTPKGVDLFSDQAIATIDDMGKDLLTIQGVTGVLSMVNVPLLYSPKVTVSQLKDKPRTLLTPGVDRDMAKQEFLESPIYRKLILSPDGQTTAILANIELDQKYIDLVRHRDALRYLRKTEGLSQEQEQELTQVSKEFLDYRTARSGVEKARVKAVRELMDSYRDRAEIFLGGPSMITADMIDFIKSDLKVFGIGILLFIIATLAIIFRQLRWVFMPLTVCVLTVLIMLGWLSWIDWRLTVISSNFVALLLITTLALTIHLVVRYRELQRTSDELSQPALVRETVMSMARPCIYTVLTTAVAFVSLVVSDIRPVIDFGWMMTIGLCVAFVLSFTIIPAGMLLLGRGKNNVGEDNSAKLTSVFARFTERYGNLVLVLAVVLALISSYGLTQLKVENRFIDYFKESTEIYRGLSIIDERLGGTTPLDIVIKAPPIADVPLVLGADVGEDDPFEEDPFADADPFEADPFEDDPFAADPFSESPGQAEADPNKQSISYWFTRAGLSDLEKIHQYLDDMPEIGRVDSLVTPFHVANDLMGHRLNDLELTFMRRSLSPEMERLLLASYLEDEINETRITMRTVESAGNLNRNELLAEIESFLMEEMAIPPERFALSGLQVLYNNMLQSLFHSQIVTLGAVFLGIMLMFLILFRSVKISLLAILPNLLAASIVLGSMGIFGIPLDMMTITIAAITVGIGVDHAIHYITRFKREFVVDHNYIASMHRTHASIGLALFYTAITIIMGFSILAFSNFIPSVYFGLLTALAMTAALLGSLTLLPRLIVLFKPLGPNRD